MQKEKSGDEEDGYSSSDNVPLSTFCSTFSLNGGLVVPCNEEYPQVSMDYDTFSQIQDIISKKHFGSISVVSDSDVGQLYEGPKF